MKSPKDIENVLQRLGSAWPGDDSIVERVMLGIESPPLVAAPKPRRILMKSLLAIAASFAACVALWWAVEGDHNSLYAQVIDGVRKARTLHITHYVQLKGKAEPTKTSEAWYESGVGFRRDIWDWTHQGRHYTTCLGNAESTWSLDRDRKNPVIRSPSKGIAKETEQIFADIDRHAQHLQNGGLCYPEGDQTFDGQPCKAYVLGSSDQADLQLKTAKLRPVHRQLFYLDQQSRLVRVVTEERDGGRWNATEFNAIAYDEPLDVAFFRPHFGKDFKIVDAGAKPAKPEATKPEGPVLVYEVDSKSMPAGATTVDMDKLLRTVDVRLNGGNEPLAAVRKLNDRRIEVTLMRRNGEDRGRVERQLTRPGTLEFRLLANRHVDKALIDRALKEPAKTEILDPSGKRLAWWVPVKAGSQRGFHSPEIAKRTRKVGDRTVTEILVVADPYNVTGACLSRVKLQFDLREEPCVGCTFNEAGGRLFGKLTGDHLPNDSIDLSYKLGIIVDGELLSAPAIRSRISSKGEITGSFTEIEVSDLAATLNAGSLPVRLRLVEERPHP